MNRQSYEKLIRLEDEEIESSELDHDRIPHHRDACHVPMSRSCETSPAGSIIEEDREKYKQVKASNLSGINFTLGSTHIQINPNQLKYISLMTLTIQNAALSLTMRAANTQAEKFSTPIAVTVAEILKLITCIAFVWYEEITFSGAIRAIKTNVIQNWLDTLKVAVPSFVYYIQNNLLYVGSTHLDAATCQVTYQLKILTTAVFSVLILNKKLNKIQWFALFILFAGVALIQTMAVSDYNKTPLNATSKHATGVRSDHGTERPIVGFVALLIACCMSGFAGVYFEKILKNTTNVSLWIRNIQLTAAAIPIGLVQVFILEHEHLTSKGFFYGFTPLTWLCISLQVQGGLLVAVVVKFANNILKGFATSLAIVISTVASMFLFDFNLTPTFVLGTMLVIGSVMMYSKQ